MNGHQKANRLKYSVILALGLSMAQIAGAVGLGPIVGVNSHMGQPLNASIRVDNLTKEEAQSLRVSLASAEEYRSRGIQRLPIHDQLRFKLTPAGSGYRIQVSSSKGIREPFINFLLTINVGGQKITREYALFLNPDPAGGTSAPSEPQPALQESKPQQIATVAPAPSNGSNIALGSGSDLIGQARPSNAIPPASASQEGWGGNTGNGTRVALQNQAPTPAVANVGGGKYTVKSGDTLYRIAQAATPAGGDINAMMQAIQRANPHAFGNANMNSLKAGAHLTIPGSTIVANATPPSESAPRHSKRNQRRNTPAPQMPSAAETPAMQDVAANTAADGQQDAPASTDMPNIGDEGAAPALTAEVGQETTVPADTTPAEATQDQGMAQNDGTTPSGMDTSLTLEGMGGIESTAADLVAQNETPLPSGTVPGDLPQPDAPLEMPPTPESSEQASVATTTLPPASEAPTVQPATISTADTQPVPSSASSLELPFGLQLWHLLLAGGLLVTAILLTLLMKARRGRGRDDARFDEMSPADLDRMASELESDPSLQRALSGGLHDLDDLSFEALSQSQEQEKLQQHAQSAQMSERERLKARMAELDALESLDDEQDDFKQLQQKASQVPSFDLHLNSTGSVAAAAPAHHETASNNLFDDWDFDEQESTVQTSAHESNVDDFFNVDEKLEEVIKPASTVERVSFTRSDLQATTASAAVDTVDPEKIEAMEINLDLATSFIATGNAARARIWLEEVLLEGSPAQKALAAQLLKKVELRSS